MDYVLIKGAGDLATGVARVFKEAGYRVIMTEIKQPTCVRRKVSFAQAVYAGEIRVEGIRARLARDFHDAMGITDQGDIAVLVDPRGEIRQKHRPTIFIEATLAKKNLGTSIEDADLVVALGPGFQAGVDVHAVIETQRGPHLGQPIYQGLATPDTGIPGNVLGYTSQRVLRAPDHGVFKTQCKIGDLVKPGDIIAFINSVPVKTQIAGVVRGLLKDGLLVHQGMKVGDVHPAHDPAVCFKMTDKAWTVGRGALLAVETLLKSH